MTILSVNKTRELDGRYCAHFLFMGADCAYFSFSGGNPMRKNTRFVVYAAVLAALYVVLTHVQNLLIPDSATWAIQYRASEALCVMALFTPAAIPGLALGCMLFNFTYAQALPLDFVVGSLATLLACGAMYLTRNFKVRGFPALALVMPALFNAVLVGWELTVYIGGGFFVNAVSVAIGELAVLFTLGSLLYFAICRRGLEKRLFA